MPKKTNENPYAPPVAVEFAEHNINPPTKSFGLNRLLLWCFAPSLLAMGVMILAKRPSLVAFVYAPIGLFFAEGGWVILLGKRDLLLLASSATILVQCVLIGLIRLRQSQVEASAVAVFGLLKAAWSAYFWVYLVSYLA
ncbi:hypothetical protein [Fuerstiella marisgermanici]|uniref:Uncharacterized protein n=1 Tax=Fuerstiella marisgermanici TaxID=1891926 RepID=A0A1P8WQE0_9PLAN|nr:hypothetical protein [Fuerstiella marisgermanici]APZ96276.1 hypothetical protein Fuma_05944 [Fuerstiella marisgermanici]